MGGPKYISTMDKWMADVQRRIEKLERRKHHRAFVRNSELTGSTGPLVGFTASDGVVTLAVGTVLRDNGDGTLTVVDAPTLTEYDEL